MLMLEWREYVRRRLPRFTLHSFPANSFVQLFIKNKYDRVLPTIEAIMIVLPLDTEEGNKFHLAAVREYMRCFAVFLSLCGASIRSFAMLARAVSACPFYRSSTFLPGVASLLCAAAKLGACCFGFALCSRFFAAPQLQHFKSMHIKNKMFRVSLKGTKFESLGPILSGPVRFYYLVRRRAGRQARMPLVGRLEAAAAAVLLYRCLPPSLCLHCTAGRSLVEPLPACCGFC